MDKKIILAVAGSGKTSLLIDHLTLEQNTLLITYTNNNFSNLRQRIIHKFGYLPENIRLYTYFVFLYSFCYRPFLALTVKAKGLNFERPPAYTMRFSRDRIDYYIDKQKRLYHNRVAKLLEQYNALSDINMRIEKYFDNIFIDEVQDFAGHDFNLLLSICQSDIDIIMVGDFFQHTYDTSRDGTVNKNLHSDYHNYLNNFRTIGFNLDLESLNKSYRCSPTICKFISDNIGIAIDSHRHDETLVYLIEDENEIEEKLNSSSLSENAVPDRE